MRVLLDTHLLLWALAAPSKLPATARKQIEAAEVFVSAASIWEISIKSALGKLAADPREVLDAVEQPVSTCYRSRASTRRRSESYRRSTRIRSIDC